jgi:hypothetical protein
MLIGGRAAVPAHGMPSPFVNDTTLLTNVASEYAPDGWHLLAAHVLDVGDLDDSGIDQHVRADLARIFPHMDLAAWRTLRVVRTPRSQFVQAPGAPEVLPTRTTSHGLYLAGELIEDSSINGALRSGEATARAVYADLIGRRSA